MASSHSYDIVPFTAGADLSAEANRYKAVKLDAAGNVVLCSAAGEPVLGSLYELGASGKAVGVAIGNGVKFMAGATIANAGTPLKTDANGKLVAAAAGTVNTSDAGVAADPVIGSHVVGFNGEAAADGKIITVYRYQSTGAVPTTAA
jgi:hypothetical protein